MEGSEVSLAALGIVATIAGALVWLLKKLFAQNDGTIKRNNLALSRLASAIDNSANASEALQLSIRERDARDREFHTKVMENFEKIGKSLDKLDQKADNTIEALGQTRVTKQHVETQIVKQEVVQQKQDAS